jgi:hypothetical protein
MLHQTLKLGARPSERRLLIFFGCPEPGSGVLGAHGPVWFCFHDAPYALSELPGERN